MTEEREAPVQTPNRAPAGPAYYHGTAHEYKPGELVEPGHRDNYPGLGEADKGRYAYATSDLDDAKDHAHNARLEDWDRRDFELSHPGAPVPSRGHVYPVGFTSEREADPETPETSVRSRSPLRVTGPAIWHERFGAATTTPR